MPAFSYRSLRDRIADAREAAERGVRNARRVFEEAREEASQAVRQMGLPEARANVIDVGDRPGGLTRLLHGAAGVLILALLAGGAVTLFTFFLQLLAAYLLAVGVLGLRLDLDPQAR